MTGLSSLFAAAGAAALRPFAVAYARLVRVAVETPFQRFEREVTQAGGDYRSLVLALWRFEQGGPDKVSDLVALSALGAIERGAFEDSITVYGAAILRDARRASLI